MIRAADTTIRVLVRPPDALSTRTARAVLIEALNATSWGKVSGVRCTSVDAPPDSVARNDLVLEVVVPDTSGAPRYVQRAHDLVQRLYDTEKFTRVEADIAVPAFDPSGVEFESVAPARPRRRERLGADAPRAAAGANDCLNNAAAAAHDWALQSMRVPAALALIGPAAAAGKGILIGHPDSGYSDHPLLGLGQLALQKDRDVISGDDDAVDPLKKPTATVFNALPNSGHGTSTASVAAGFGEAGGAVDRFRGVATGATIVPIRATESVVQVFDLDVAKAVRWARTHDCHIVSMSLGGKGLFGLEDAIQEAVNSGMIVMAAAGNQVGFVTAPASYPNCIAVAATNADDTPWSRSSHGSQIDVSAPGACVWSAMFDWSLKPPGRVLRQSHGTSYSVAYVAGVAALWLAHHGHATLVARYGRPHIQDLFLSVLRTPGVCRRPAGWDTTKWGVGIVDAEAILKARLPAPQAVAVPVAAMRSVRNDPLERLALHTDGDVATVGAALDASFGAGSSGDLNFLRRFEGELAFQRSSVEGRAALAGGGAPVRGSGRRGARRRRPGMAAGPAEVLAPTLVGLSPQLAAHLKHR